MVYFSDRELGARPRTHDEITPAAWMGIAAAIAIRIEDGSFGYTFPDMCTHWATGGILGTHSRAMGQAVAREFPYLEWPLNPEHIPSVYDALDLVQFCYDRVASVIGRDYHEYLEHYHLTYDTECGRAEFRALVNRIFARNELAFELTQDGEIIRLASVVLRETLEAATFATGDATLDQLLETSRHKFLSHNPDTRTEGLEKLWDAWERLKTIEPGKDKRGSVTVLFDRTASERNFRQLLEDESTALTTVGNNFMIRHTEVGKTPITSPEHVDYLFHRLFALIRLALRSTGRGG
jgi:hypothetical protein